MKTKEVEKELRSMGIHPLTEDGKRFYMSGDSRVLIQERDGDILLSSVVGLLSEVLEQNIPNALVAFLDANQHLQPASLGIMVENNDMAVKAMVLIDRVSDRGSLQRSLNALEMAIRASAAIMSQAASEVALA